MFEKVLILIIITTCITNAYADLLLASGDKRQGEGLSYIDKYFAIAKTNTYSNQIKSGIIGGVSIGSWMLLIYFLLKIDGGIWSTLAILTYAIFCGINMLTHVLTTSIFQIIKSKDAPERELKKYLLFYSIVCTVFGTLFSFIMGYMGVVGILPMRWYHYITLPICTIILVQFVLGTLVKNDKFEIIAGTLGQCISMLMIINLILS